MTALPLLLLCCAHAGLAQFHNPGGQDQLFNDLHRLGDAALEGYLDPSFGASLPKESILAPPPKTSHLHNVRDIVSQTIARAVEATGQVERPDSRHLALLLSVLSCAAVVFCGVLPAIFFPIETGQDLHSKLGARHLNLLLAFAVGSLTGDVCLHIFPEVWSHPDIDLKTAGLLAIAGLLLCFLVEKCCEQTEESQHRAAAWLNLAANLIDNFTHGLAVASSFMLSIKFGLLTTLAILLHEVPHEISDFAILLRADFDRWQAIRAQLLTASGGIVGACCALLLQGSALGIATQYVLAFTAGGFLNIALVEILPDILKEQCPRESAKQCALVVLGIAVMGAVNLLHF